jgi:hypothetical protein
MQFNSYSRKKKEQQSIGKTIDDDYDVKTPYDAEFVENIEIKLNKILEEKSKMTVDEDDLAAEQPKKKRGLRDREREGKIEKQESPKKKRARIKYLKYKLKYLKVKNKNLK